MVDVQNCGQYIYLSRRRRAVIGLFPGSKIKKKVVNMKQIRYLPFFALLSLLAVLVLAASPVVVINFPGSDSLNKGDIMINVSTDISSNITINITNSSGSVLASILSDEETEHLFNWQTANGSYADGVYSLTAFGFNATNESEVGAPAVNTNITVDNTAPAVIDAAYIRGSLGFGILYGDADEFYSTAAGNNLINISINLTDFYAGVANATFDFSDLCGTSGIAAAFADGLWWASCTVDQQGEFEQKNITFSSCDNLGNCNSELYRTVILYNFTTPEGQAGVMEFGSGTTNLSAETDLNAVNYVLDIELNGSILSGAPWEDFQSTALFNFSSINFTRSDIGGSLAALSDAVDVEISAPRTYGTNRIYINSSAFAELNTTTTITLYNLPFTSQPNITGDEGAAGVVAVNSWISSGQNGNLTFTVSGFSGYNISDLLDPVIVINSPNNDSAASALAFNATFNGTGTEINNASIALVFINSSGSTFNYTYSDLGCTLESAEVMTCAGVIPLADGTYNLTLYAEDYGSASGNSATVYGSNITLDSSFPEVTFNAPEAASWHNADFVLNVTATSSSAVKYRLENGTNSSHIVVDWTEMSNLAGDYWNATIAGTTADGNYTVRINATGTLGNINDTETRVISIDDTDPYNVSVSCDAVNVGSSRSCSCSANDNSESFGGSLTYSYSGDSTAAAGTTTVTCTAADPAGNTNTSTATYTVNAVSSSGGTGGGGSATTQVAGSFVKAVWHLINENEPTILAADNGELGLTEIVFELSQKTYGGWLEAKKRDSLPEMAKPFGKKVYLYLEIIKGNAIKEENLKNVKIRFKVDNSWLTEKGLNPGSISLFRYAGEKWVELGTAIKSDDGKYTYYEAETPGFSYFLIGESEEAVVEETAAEETRVVPTKPIVEEVSDERMETVPAETEKSYDWIWWVLGLIAAAVIIIYFFRQKRK